jgi:hypothetical protein
MYKELAFVEALPINEVVFCPAACIPYQVPEPTDVPLTYSVAVPPVTVTATYVHVVSGIIEEPVMLLTVPS